nr:MAG TPA: PVL ORF-50-like family [Caudoviricetes sp.]
MHKTHNMSNTRIYRIWNDVKARCYYVGNDNYKYYGKRGITMCEEWKDSFENFYNWAINAGYNDDLTLDRIDTNGGYYPSNCRWITLTEQCRNRRNNVKYKYNGEEKTLKEWEEIYGVPSATSWARINKYGWDVAKAITYNEEELYEYNGKSQILSDWATELGIKYTTLRARIKAYKWPIEKAFNTKTLK